MPVDLKSLTPDTSFGSGAFLFGADSQSAADPSVFPQATVFDYWKTLDNTWSGVNTFSGSITGNANVLDVRNGTSTQTFQLLNTYSSAGTNYERLAAKFATFSSALQARLVAESAGTGAANIGINLTPRGTGPFIFGPMPDGTSTGGNNRGTNAVDLQMVRSAATQVASGANSFVTGGNNTASGQYGFAWGLGSVASGLQSFAGGNGSQATNSFSFAVGHSCIASGSIGFALGYGATASGAVATAFGLQCTAAGQEAVAMGSYASAPLRGQRAFASNCFDTQGAGQESRFELSNSTTNATPTELFLGAPGSTARATVTANKTYEFLVRLTARRSGGSEQASWWRRGMITRDGANNTALVGSVQTIGTDIGSNAGAPPAGWALAITADDTNESLKVEVTGAAATNIRWVAHVYMTEVLYA